MADPVRNVGEENSRSQEDLANARNVNVENSRMKQRQRPRAPANTVLRARRHNQKAAPRRAIAIAKTFTRGTVRQRNVR